MRIKGSRGLWLAVAIGFCASVVMSAQTTVNFGITGAGPTGNSLAGVYTDPYQGCVGCTSMQNLGSPVPIFCDDFTDEVSPPEFWTAFATGLNAFTGTGNVSSVYYASSVTQPPAFQALPNLLTGANNTAWITDIATGFTQTNDYIAAAILAAQSITAGAGNPMAQNDLSFALWGIFDPGLLVNTTSASTYGTMDSVNLGFAQTDLENALVAAKGYSSGAEFTQQTGINATIYSDCTGCSVGQTGKAGSVVTGVRPQEFITVSMPEPSFASLLVTDLVGMAAIGFFLRRRASQKN